MSSLNGELNDLNSKEMWKGLCFEGKRKREWPRVRTLTTPILKKLNRPTDEPKGHFLVSFSIVSLVIKSSWKCTGGRSFGRLVPSQLVAPAAKVRLGQQEITITTTRGP